MCCLGAKIGACDGDDGGASVKIASVVSRHGLGRGSFLVCGVAGCLVGARELVVLKSKAVERCWLEVAACDAEGRQ